MIHQILVLIVMYFLMWSVVLSLQLMIGIFTYENLIFDATTKQILIMTQEFQKNILQGTLNQIQFSIGIQD